MNIIRCFHMYRTPQGGHFIWHILLYSCCVDWPLSDLLFKVMPVGPLFGVVLWEYVILYLWCCVRWSVIYQDMMICLVTWNGHYKYIYIHHHFVITSNLGCVDSFSAKLQPWLIMGDHRRPKAHCLWEWCHFSSVTLFNTNS